MSYDGIEFVLLYPGGDPHYPILNRGGTSINTLESTHVKNGIINICIPFKSNVNGVEYGQKSPFIPDLDEMTEQEKKMCENYYDKHWTTFFRVYFNDTSAKFEKSLKGTYEKILEEVRSGKEMKIFVECTFINYVRKDKIIYT